jgi:ferredoxin-fold anticodon binding domain-containing protein
MSNENGLSKYYGLLKYAIDGDYLIETKKGRSKAYQLKHQVDAVGEEEAEKYLKRKFIFSIGDVLRILEKIEDGELKSFKKNKTK